MVRRQTLKGAWHLLGACALALACGHAEPPVRNVVVYLVDTLRADHLGCYGYALPTSPVLDGFARQGVLFENAYAQSSWTRPSVASILTGLAPRRHGANRRRTRLAEEAVTLAERLAAAGFHGAGFVTNPNVGGTFGFRQGFERYHMVRSKRSGDSVREAARVWLEAKRAAGDERRFFLYLHTVEPHAPYRDAVDRAAAFGARLTDPEIGRRAFMHRLGHREIQATVEMVAEMRALYDAEIAANDEQFGALLADLESLGLQDSTAVLFVSDHGEEFGEHGKFEHSKSLYEESMRVPLVLRVPGKRDWRGVRVRERAQHVDLVPTLLDLVGLPVPDGLDGRSLLPLLPGGDAARDRPARERDVVTDLDVDGARLVAIHRGPWKLIRGGGDPDGDPLRASAWLFDLNADPTETRDLAAAQPAIVEALTALLRRRAAASVGGLRAPEVEIDEELRRQLEALGYVQ